MIFKAMSAAVALRNIISIRRDTGSRIWERHFDPRHRRRVVPHKVWAGGWYALRVLALVSVLLAPAILRLRGIVRVQSIGGRH